MAKFFQLIYHAIAFVVNVVHVDLFGALHQLGIFYIVTLIFQLLQHSPLTNLIINIESP